MMSTQTNNTEQTTLRTEAIETVSYFLRKINCGNDGNFMDHLAMLLSQNEDGVTFDESAAHNYRFACLQILSILADPETSKKVDKRWQPDIGKLLVRMVDFF